MMKSRAEELLDSVQNNIECPPATQDIISAASLGYCDELFDFKCAGSRTCDAWITNGPIK